MQEYLSKKVHLKYLCRLSVKLEILIQSMWRRNSENSCGIFHFWSYTFYACIFIDFIKHYNQIVLVLLNTINQDLVKAEDS